MRTGHRCIRIAARAAALLALTTVGACATSPDPQPLRVMTYNIAAGRGDLDAVADVIRRAEPDVVALQEVDVRWSERSGFADQATALGAALGMHVRFGPIYSLPARAGTARNPDRAAGADTARNPGRAAGTPPREFGLAILSRAPIVEFTNHIIPRLSTQTDATEPVPMPGFLEAVIDVGGARLRVFNTHLDYRADPRVREQQVAAMLAIIGDGGGAGAGEGGVRGGGGAPSGSGGPSGSRRGAVILAGDLNARPDAAELQPLLTRFTDAWSIRSEAGETYPAETPDRRIDYILLSDHFRVVDVHVPAALASDHRPVVADVLVTR